MTKANKIFPLLDHETEAQDQGFRFIFGIAKVTRDRAMQCYDRVFPQYGFGRHKGYPTQMHREVLRRHGPCLIHRRSFNWDGR